MDKIKYFDLLDRSTAETLKLAHSLTPKQLTYARPGRWSAMQILEHICMAESSIGKILVRPSDKVSEQAELIGNERIRKLVVEERHRTVVAPERMIPRGEITTVADFETAFVAQRNALKEDIASGAKTIDNRVFMHPSIGEMTISDWMYFSLSHTERHLDQIRENLKEMEKI